MTVSASKMVFNKKADLQPLPLAMISSYAKFEIFKLILSAVIGVLLGSIGKQP